MIDENATSLAEAEPSDYTDKEKGYVQPFDDYVNEMLDYIDNYGVDEPSFEARRKMMKDAQVKAVVELLKEAVLSNGFDINYNWDEDKEQGQEMVNFLYQAFERINEHPWSAGGIDDLIEKWMDALWFKQMCCELVWAHDSAKEEIYVNKAKVLPPESLKYSIDRYGNLLTIQQFPYNIELEEKTGSFGYEGVEVGPIKLDLNRLLVWVNGDDYGRYQGKSELDPVYKYWFLKDFILKFWSIFIERFGAPLLIGFVRAKNMDAAREGLKKIITDTAFAMERDDKLEIIEPKKEGDTFKSFIQYCDAEITKGLLVPTLLMDVGEKGSKSLGDVHFKLFEYRIQYIQRKIQNLVSALVKKLINLNFKDVKHYPTFTFKPMTIKDRVKMAQAFELLVKSSLVHPLEPWIRGELKLPELDAKYSKDLEEMWKAKATRGGAPGAGFGTSTAAITRTEAQTPQREPAEVGDSFTELSEREGELKRQFDKADTAFQEMLVPSVKKVTGQLVGKVTKHLGIELAKTPTWLKTMTVDGTVLKDGFNEMVDDLLIEVTGEDNRHLAKLGMESSFDVPTRTGRFKWIDANMASIKSGLHDYATNNAAALELRILEDTKRIVQEGLDKGLRGRDVVKNLREGLGSKYSDARLWTITRTNTTAIVNQGKKGFARANSDFVRGMRFLAVIDDNTTDICRELDGKQFALNDPLLDKYTPPLDFNCRSALDYITEGLPKFDPSGVVTSVPEGFGEVI